MRNKNKHNLINFLETNQQMSNHNYNKYDY